MAKEGLKKVGYIIHENSDLKVRLISVNIEKQVEVLITNLWEEEGHDPDIFKDLYFMRWGIETNLSIQNKIMQIESYSDLTVNAVIQYFYAIVMITNLHSSIIKDAQKTLDKQKNYYKKIPGESK